MSIMTRIDFIIVGLWDCESCFTREFHALPHRSTPARFVYSKSMEISNYLPYTVLYRAKENSSFEHPTLKSVS